MIAPNKLLEQLQSLQASYLLWRLNGIDLKYNYAVMNPAVYICHEHTDWLSATGKSEVMQYWMFRYLNLSHINILIKNHRYILHCREKWPRNLVLMGLCQVTMDLVKRNSCKAFNGSKLYSLIMGWIIKLEVTAMTQLTICAQTRAPKRLMFERGWILFNKNPLDKPPQYLSHHRLLTMAVFQIRATSAFHFWNTLS